MDFFVKLREYGLKKFIETTYQTQRYLLNEGKLTEYAYRSQLGSGSVHGETSYQKIDPSFIMRTKLKLFKDRPSDLRIS